MVAVGFNIEGSLDALPLPTQLRVVPHGEFVLVVFGLGFDQILVGSLLNLKFMTGYGRADGFVWRFRQHFNDQSVGGAEGLPFFQNLKAIIEHILNVKRPEGGRHKHPIVEATELFDGRGVQFNRHGMIPANCLLGPIGPVKGLGLDFFQVLVEGGRHISTVALNVWGEEFEPALACLERETRRVGERPAVGAAGAKAEIRKAETRKALSDVHHAEIEPRPRLPDGNGLQLFQARRPAGGFAGLFLHGSVTIRWNCG